MCIIVFKASRENTFNIHQIRKNRKEEETQERKKERKKGVTNCYAV